MNQYKDYSLEDFVLDAQFQNWVRYRHSADEAYWQIYLRNNPDKAHDIHQAHALLESVYRHYESDISDSEIDVEIHELLNKVRTANRKGPGVPNDQIKVSLGQQFIGRISVFWAAATIIFGLSLGWLYQHNHIWKSSYRQLTSGKLLKEIVNETATNKIVSLADSSEVILKPHSRISFPVEFLPDKREVYLTGEASFHVSKDPKRPFLVYANELVTKVLGTTFTVNARDAAQKTTVEVTEGKVSVFRQTDYLDTKDQKVLQSKGLVLMTNQKLVFERASSHMLKTLRDSPEVISSNGNPKTFDFVNEPASVVLGDLRDAYQVDIIFDKDLLSDCPITASLANQPLFEKLDIICEVIEAHYEMLDGKIVVYSKGCRN